MKETRMGTLMRSEKERDEKFLLERVRAEEGEKSFGG